MKIDNTGLYLLWNSSKLDNGLICPSGPTDSITKVLTEAIKNFGQKHVKIWDNKKFMDYST